MKIYHELSFYKELFDLDFEIAKKFQASKSCVRCEGPLGFDNYPRKPRGIPKEAEQFYQFRFSFTCRHCRKRVTPPTVRFTGRKVYVSLVVLLLPFFEIEDIEKFQENEPSLSKTTMKRWVKWWRNLPLTSPWKKIQGFISPNKEKKAIPLFLVKLFKQTCINLLESYKSLLKFISPMTTPLDYLKTIRIIP